VAGERADHGEPVLGPGRGDVQAPLAAVAQQRAPLVAHAAVPVLAVADGQDDRVPLVALHPLQVLDEEGLRHVVGEERLDPGVNVAQRLAQGQVDALGVLHAERDHPQGLRRPGARVLEDQLDHPVHLGGHRGVLARRVVLGHDHVPQAVVT